MSNAEHTSCDVTHAVWYVWYRYVCDVTRWIARNTISMSHRRELSIHTITQFSDRTVCLRCMNCNIWWNRECDHLLVVLNAIMIATRYIYICWFAVNSAGYFRRHEVITWLRSYTANSRIRTLYAHKMNGKQDFRDICFYYYFEYYFWYKSHKHRAYGYTKYKYMFSSENVHLCFTFRRERRREHIFPYQLFRVFGLELILSRQPNQLIKPQADYTRFCIGIHQVFDCFHLRFSSHKNWLIRNTPIITIECDDFVNLYI